MQLSRLASPRLALPGLALLMVAGAVLIFYETRGTTFWSDEWVWILYRRDYEVDTFLQPHNEHLSLFPVAIYKLMFETFGVDDYRPYRFLAIAGHLTCVTLLFAYARRRVGGPAALLVAALLLVFGRGWEEFLWTFQIAWLITLAAGLGALLMLDRQDRLGDVAACVLLVVSLGSSGVGAAVALGLVVEIWRGRRRLRDAWIVAVPIGLYAVWWLSYQSSVFGGYGDEEGGTRVRSALGSLLENVIAAAAGTMAAVVGLGGETVPDRVGSLLTWGPPLLVVAVAAILWRRSRIGGLPPRVWTLLTILVAFWFLTALSGRDFLAAHASRYLYVSGFLVFLIAVELARGISLTPRAGLLLTTAVAFVALTNVAVMRDAGRYLRGESHVTTAELGAMRLARPTIRPFEVGDPALPWYLNGIRNDPPSYFAAEAELGTPADTPAELAAAPERARVVADRELVRSRRIVVRAAPRAAAAGAPPVVEGATGGSAARRGACVSLRPAGVLGAGETARLDVTVPSAGVVVSSGDRAALRVRRFADGFQPAGTLARAARASVEVATDAAPDRWHLSVESAGATTICGRG